MGRSRKACEKCKGGRLMFRVYVRGRDLSTGRQVFAPLGWWCERCGSLVVPANPWLAELGKDLAREAPSEGPQILHWAKLLAGRRR